MKRDSSIDIAKAFGIIFVVIGHTDFRYSQVLYQFHIPLFFFLSGMVFNTASIKPLKYFVVKKLKALYLPFISFELLFLLFHNILCNIGFYTEESNKKLIYSTKDFIINGLKILVLGGGEQLAGPLWFLISSLEIVFIYAALYLLLAIIKKSYLRDIVLGVISFVLYFIGCNTDFPRMLSQSLIGLFFFCIGNIYRQYREKIELRWYGAILSFVVILIASSVNFVDISKLDISYIWMLPITGLAGSYFILFISKQVSKMKRSIFLCYCGRNSLYVLALHCISFKFVMIAEIIFYKVDLVYLGKFPTYEYNWIWQLPLTIFGVILPLGAKYLFDYFRRYVHKGKKALLEVKQEGE